MKIPLTSLFKKNKVNSASQILHEISFNQNLMKEALSVISLKNEIIEEVLRSSKKRVLWLTYEFDNEGDFAIYYDFLEEPYDTYPCRGKEWVWGTGWLPEEYRDWNERTPCLIMDELTNNIIEDSCFCNLIFDNLMMASVGFINTEDRSFEITPKRIKRTSDTVLTPEMKVIVTTDIHTTDPFYNGAKEIKEAYMRLYGFDYQKACCSKNDFEFKKLD